MRVGMLFELREAERQMKKVFGNPKAPIQKILTENVKLLDAIADKQRSYRAVSVEELRKLAPKGKELNLQVQELYDAFLVLSRIVSDLGTRDISIR